VTDGLTTWLLLNTEFPGSEIKVTNCNPKWAFVGVLISVFCLLLPLLWLLLWHTVEHAVYQGELRYASVACLYSDAHSQLNQALSIVRIFCLAGVLSKVSTQKLRYYLLRYDLIFLYTIIILWWAAQLLVFNFRPECFTASNILFNH